MGIKQLLIIEKLKERISRYNNKLVNIFIGFIFILLIYYTYHLFSVAFNNFNTCYQYFCLKLYDTFFLCNIYSFMIEWAAAQLLIILFCAAILLIIRDKN